MKEALVIAMALALSGCATDEFKAGSVTSPDYIASGQIGAAKAWVYAQRTVFEGREGKEYKFTRPTGEVIAASKIGVYHRMDSLERDFVVSDGLHTMRFVLSPATWTFSHTGATYEGGLTQHPPQ